MVGKGGLPPLVECLSSRAGASRPYYVHGLYTFPTMSSFLLNYSLCLCASVAHIFPPSANLELSLRARVLASDCWPIAISC